uniref:Chromatin modification-related protein eaf-1-like n=1 Tax=Saccoglossus kowalevskii TaxID=10224 RepID=A0ABM0GKB8_SACKO|nr:PREDICTED: chromatin modification-related protein eaf-1-like [Saccoglossus kowalevskii]
MLQDSLDVSLDRYDGFEYPGIPRDSLDDNYRITNNIDSQKLEMGPPSMETRNPLENYDFQNAPEDDDPYRQQQIQLGGGSMRSQPSSANRRVRSGNSRISSSHSQHPPRIPSAKSTGHYGSPGSRHGSAGRPGSNGSRDKNPRSHSGSRHSSRNNSGGRLSSGNQRQLRSRGNNERYPSAGSRRGEIPNQETFPSYGYPQDIDQSYVPPQQLGDDDDDDGGEDEEYRNPITSSHDDGNESDTLDAEEQYQRQLKERVEKSLLDIRRIEDEEKENMAKDYVDSLDGDNANDPDIDTGMLVDSLDTGARYQKDEEEEERFVVQPTPQKVHRDDQDSDPEDDFFLAPGKRASARAQPRHGSSTQPRSADDLDKRQSYIREQNQQKLLKYGEHHKTDDPSLNDPAADVQVEYISEESDEEEEHFVDEKGSPIDNRGQSLHISHLGSATSLSLSERKRQFVLKSRPPRPPSHPNSGEPSRRKVSGARNVTPEGAGVARKGSSGTQTQNAVRQQAPTPPQDKYPAFQQQDHNQTQEEVYNPKPLSQPHLQQQGRQVFPSQRQNETGMQTQTQQHYQPPPEQMNQSQQSPPGPLQSSPQQQVQQMPPHQLSQQTPQHQIQHMPQQQVMQQQMPQQQVMQQQMPQQHVMQQQMPQQQVMQQMPQQQMQQSPPQQNPQQVHQMSPQQQNPHQPLHQQPPQYFEHPQYQQYNEQPQPQPLAAYPNQSFQPQHQQVYQHPPPGSQFQQPYSQSNQQDPYYQNAQTSPLYHGYESASQQPMRRMPPQHQQYPQQPYHQDDSFLPQSQGMHQRRDSYDDPRYNQLQRQEEFEQGRSRPYYGQGQPPQQLQQIPAQEYGYYQNPIEDPHRHLQKPPDTGYDQYSEELPNNQGVMSNRSEENGRTQGRKRRPQKYQTTPPPAPNFIDMNKNVKRKPQQKSYKEMYQMKQRETPPLNPHQPLPSISRESSVDVNPEDMWAQRSKNLQKTKSSSGKQGSSKKSAKQPWTKQLVSEQRGAVPIRTQSETSLQSRKKIAPINPSPRTSAQKVNLDINVNIKRMDQAEENLDIDVSVTPRPEYPIYDNPYINPNMREPPPQNFGQPKFGVHNRNGSGATYTANSHMRTYSQDSQDAYPAPRYQDGGGGQGGYDGLSQQQFYEETPRLSYTHPLDGLNNPSHGVLPGIDKVGRSSRTSQEDGYLARLQKQKSPPQYKQYTLKDYRNLKSDIKMGGLGPDIETMQQRQDKVQRGKQYARDINTQNRRVLAQQKPRKLPRPGDGPEENDIHSKRHVAIEYSKKLRKPQTVNGQNTPHRNSSKNSERSPSKYSQLDEDMAKLEELQARHERERQEIDKLKQQVSAPS